MSLKSQQRRAVAKEEGPYQVKSPGEKARTASEDSKA